MKFRTLENHDHHLGNGKDIDIRFNRGLYETENEKEIEFLKNHSSIKLVLENENKPMKKGK